MAKKTTTSADTDLAELENLLSGEGKSETKTEAPAAASVAEVSEADLEHVEAVGEAYEGAAPGSDTVAASEIAEAPKKGSRKKATADGEPKASRPKYASASEAVLARIDSNIEFVALDKSRTAGDVAAMKAELVTTVDNLSKKVKEKAVNVFAAAAAGIKLSTYTEIALRLLKDKGTVSSKDMIEAIAAAPSGKGTPYGMGTARAQGNQMFQLLPALRIAVKDGKNLVLNNDSTLLPSLLKA